MNNFYSGFIMKFRGGDKVWFLRCVESSARDFLFFFFPFFQISSNIFLACKTCVHSPGIFFFFSFYIGMLRESVWEVARCGWKCFWKKNCIALLISIFSGTFSPRHGRVTRFFFSRESVEVKKVGKCHVSKYFFTFTLFIIQSIE